MTISRLHHLDTIDGAYVVVFRDPDNIQLELVAER